MNAYTTRIAVAALFATSLPTMAAAPAEEWRVLGPAFSYHLTTDGAQYSGEKSWGCKAQHLSVTQVGAGKGTVVRTDLSTFTVANPGSVTNNLAPSQAVTKGLVDAPAGSATVTSYYGGAQRFVVVGAQTYSPSTGAADYNIVWCDTSGHGSEQRYQQNNPAFGLEKSWRTGSVDGQIGHVDKVFGTFVRDSYGSPSFMVGAGRQWEVLEAGGFNVDFGLVAGVWFRTKLNDDNQLVRSVTPAAMPAGSVTHQPSGLGLNVAFAPHIKHINGVNVFMFQLTYRISKSDDSQKLSIGQSVNAGVQASYDVKL